MTLKKRERPASLEAEKGRQARVLERLSGAMIFLGFLLFSGLAIAAVAIATPLVLAISAFAGLVSNNADGAAWRPAAA